MRSIAIAFLFSTFAFANHHTMSFAGKGQWTDHEGKQVPYRISVKKECLDDSSKKVTTKIEADGKQMEWTSVIVPTAVKDRFDVKTAEGAKIGWGYCYGGRVSRVCHMELNPGDGVHVEKTIHKFKHSLHTMGSMNSSEGVITWKDALIHVPTPAVPGSSLSDADLF